MNWSLFFEERLNICWVGQEGQYPEALVFLFGKDLKYYLLRLTTKSLRLCGVLPAGLSWKFSFLSILLHDSHGYHQKLAIYFRRPGRREYHMDITLSSFMKIPCYMTVQNCQLRNVMKCMILFYKSPQENAQCRRWTFVNAVCKCKSIYKNTCKTIPCVSEEPTLL